jgi:hypothetical protein
LDEYGESILIIKKEDKQRGIALLQGDIPPALSQCRCAPLTHRTRAIARHTHNRTTRAARRDEALHRVLLDALASRYAPTTDDLCTFMSYTLRGLEAWEGAGEARAEVEAGVAWLEAQGFFTRRRELVLVRPPQPAEAGGGDGGGDAGEREGEAVERREVEVLEPTPLAQATSRSGLTPLVALALRDELENARRRLIVAGTIPTTVHAEPTTYITTTTHRARCRTALQMSCTCAISSRPSATCLTHQTGWGTAHARTTAHAPPHTHALTRTTARARATVCSTRTRSWGR